MTNDPKIEAALLRKRYTSGQIPVPVESIAKAKGIRVETLSLYDELSGMAFVKDGVAVIVVNSNHHINRRRFTIAHELAHHIFDTEYLNNNVHVDKVIYRNPVSAEGTDRKEIRANKFAAELLMPTDELKKFRKVDINDDAVIQAIAKKLKVSAAALTYQLINAGQAKD